MKLVKTSGTRLEQRMRAELLVRGVPFVENSPTLPGRPDIYIPALNAIILLHGCFWHGHSCTKGRNKPKRNEAFWRKKFEHNRQRDGVVMSMLCNLGFDVCVVWECQTKKLTLIADEIAQQLSLF